MYRMPHRLGSVCRGLTPLTAVLLTGQPESAQSEATLSGAILSPARNALTVRNDTGMFE